MGVPNTFPTSNQTSGPKSQYFLPSTFRLEKTPFFLSLGSVIKSDESCDISGLKVSGVDEFVIES